VEFAQELRVVLVLRVGLAQLAMAWVSVSLTKLPP
jgi:hypothetical protein